MYKRLARELENAYHVSTYMFLRSLPNSKFTCFKCFTTIGPCYVVFGLDFGLGL
jgi:hypothetical protein